MMYWIVFVLTFIPLMILMPVKIIGKKNFDRKKNFIVTCNHHSAFDPIILNHKLKTRIRFIGKIELFNNAFKRYWMKKVFGIIPVDRKVGLNVSSTKEILNAISNKEQIGFFPEGTRKKDKSDNMTVKNGACMFAIKTKTPLLPCYIEKKQKAFKKNILLIGSPFELSEFYDKKLTHEVLAAASKVLTEKTLNLKTEYEQFKREKQIIKLLKKQKRKN